ncbi:MAG: hypothetical protein KJ687_10855 [Proteobacteria bacterium]|nr:hypothetical protein [Pseudomonadota bacterium]
MPNKISNKINDKTYHAQRKRLEKESLKLENRLNELYQQNKAIQSVSAKKIIHEKIKILQREISEKTYEMITLDGTWEKELYRRKKCKVPASRCPLAPLRPVQ